LSGIRPATAADLPAIAAIHLASSRIAYRGILPDNSLDRLTIEGRLALWRTRYAALGPQGRLWVYPRENEIIGFALADQTDVDACDLAVAELSSFYVLPAFWGLGVGRQLIEAAIDHFAQRSFERMILWTIRANLRARHFYENAGFSSDGAMRIARRHEAGVALEYDEIRYARALPAVAS
jgi:ribosomal protein S18 acetylase RimI-like enzyme